MKNCFWGLTLLFCTVFSVFPGKVNAQVTINEFMASNTTQFVDPDQQESADWIELYNDGTTLVELGGYYLTDDFDNQAKWKIPTGTQINPKGFLLIWADDLNTGLHANFKISAEGEELALVDLHGSIVDSVTFGLQEVNISMGRSLDVQKQWGYFPEPTPGSANTTPFFEGIVKSLPTFSVEGGIFQSEQSLLIHTLYGGWVRYTLDGSEPAESSLVPGSPIIISRNTVVRARIFKNGMIPGPVLTQSYFILPENKHTGLPVVSIASSPRNFWDPDTGIYVQNFKPEWEVPVNIELFEPEERDKAAFNLPAGIKINGLYSWQLPQKMLGVYFRRGYGADSLDYQLFFDKARKSFDTFALRASGNDWSNTLFRDGMIQTSVMEYTGLDISGFRPCAVYLNGEYMGIHNIREKIDEDYIIGNHGLAENSFDMVENEEYAEAGDLDAYNGLLKLLAKDLRITSNFDTVAAVMDIPNFTDLICTEIYSGNSSVDHNVMAWKPKDAGLWKWIVMDLDRGFFNVNNQLINFYVNQSSWPLSDLLKNPDYKKYFGRQLADHLFTTFHPDSIKSRIDQHAADIEKEIPAHIERWKGTSSSYGNPIPSVDYWNTEVGKLKTFAENRPRVILKDLTNYGFQPAVSLTVSTIPAGAGTILFNGMKIPVDHCSGGYPKGEEIRLTAAEKAGYSFVGWQASADTVLIKKEDFWKYDDSGSDPGPEWKNADFSDQSWKSGQAEFGYGEQDEKTVIAGLDNPQDHVTSYFRHPFSCQNTQNVRGLTLDLKCDDGAVIYLNGQEVHRYNLPNGAIDFKTHASIAVYGPDESDFHAIDIGKELLTEGENLLAVEVHQSTLLSSDASFDLGLTIHKVEEGHYLSTSKELVIEPQSTIEISALFKRDGKCILPDEIDGTLTLGKECSPYVTSRRVHVKDSARLIIEAGVEIWLSDGASIFSEGIITAKGTQAEPIQFMGNPDMKNKKWGFISLNNSPDTSFFSNVIIRDATGGTKPLEAAAIYGYRSALSLDNVRFNQIETNPVSIQFGYLSVRNSRLQSGIIGDLVHVTRGQGIIENSEFIGNFLPDNDGVDFDGATNSAIRNCTLHDFYGFNSDGVDIGENSSGISIEGLKVYNVSDKGVSVGQRSAVHVANSLFTDCLSGISVKDSSLAIIDHCTFYGVSTPVAAYEKIAGRAGGNARVSGCILSNAYEATYFYDPFSTMDISWSASDNEQLPEGRNNLFVNPHFNNPTRFDFTLKQKSACIGSSQDGDMGCKAGTMEREPDVLICDIAYLSDSEGEYPEFIGIVNPGSVEVNLTGYAFVRGISYTFSEGTIIAPGEKIFVTSDISSHFWDNKKFRVYQWESGKLANEGEEIQLANAWGVVVDEVDYHREPPWPVLDGANHSITLNRLDVDNHFGSNWELGLINDIKDSLSSRSEILEAYPNPNFGMLYIGGINLENLAVQVYNLQGIKVAEKIAESSDIFLDLKNLPPGVYVLRAGKSTRKIVLMR